MTRLTPVFLVLLRLAIGWHIFFEGLEKVNNPSWTSAAYLQESAGPLDDHFQELGGDPVLDRMALLDAPPSTPTRDRLPPGLVDEWNTYLGQFIRHYNLSEEQQQVARTRLEQRQEKTALWLLQGKKEVPGRPTQWGTPAPAEKTTPQRVEEYRQALKAYREGKEEAGTFPDGTSATLAAARAELNRQRSALLADLDAQTAEMRTTLDTVLNDKQKAMDPLVVVEADRWHTLRSMAWLKWNRLEWADFIVRWGLPVVGLCLLLGLFTRTACIAGALFLVLFYLPMPPWPGLPDNPRAEGHYLFINKNVIEMLALLALATTRSGRWVGLDALFALCCRGRKAKALEESSAEEPAPYVSRVSEPAVMRSPVPAEEPASRKILLTDAPTPPEPPPLTEAPAPLAEDQPERGQGSTIIYSPKEE
jgi:uncharacterized membrane protein YphA (DoxX/SURF4 family)